MSDRKPNLTKLSKFLALMLRHKADSFNLELDEEGFTDVDSVWKHVTKRFQGRYSYTDLLTVVEGDEYGKKRYEIRNGRIRALYGHGAVTAISYPAVEPPDSLFHGTTPQALESIRKIGLKALGRQYVHLGTNLDRVTRVAARRTKTPIILHVRAKAAYQSGMIFHNPEPEHYLTREVPPEFIDFPE
jgi:putative RNA 2'-phosphotransferase